MNSIVESVIYSEGAYWGEPERFKFRTKIDDFQNTTDQMADADRVVRTSFTLTLFGYIVPDVLVFFVNGVNCEPAAISNFVDNGNNTCTITFNVSELGFTIAATDEVVGTGKFNT